MAEGWYDPTTLQKARQNAAEQPMAGQKRGSPDYGQGERTANEGHGEIPTAEDDEDEEYGPTLPHPDAMRDVTHSGPTIPNMQDLELRRGKLSDTVFRPETTHIIDRIRD